MAKRVLILAGSPRKGGNSDTLALEFAAQAEKKGCQVDIFRPADHSIHPCMACGRCWSKDGKPCVQEDDMQKLYPLLNQADMVVFFSPLYFFGISAQLKAVIDRFYPLCQDDKMDTFSGKQSAFVIVGASGDEDSFEPAIATYDQLTDYLNWEDCGVVAATGLWEKGAAAKSIWMETARDLAMDLGEE